MNNKIIVITGPTASGKTGLGVSLAKKYNGEIISADSRQVYKGLDLGTGKDLNEYGNVKYHLIDICAPEEKFTLFDWLKLARKKIKALHDKDILPIVVGGTGLYVQALVEGFRLIEKSNIKNQIENVKIKKFTRKDLNQKTLAELQTIYSKLQTSNTKPDQNNPHRLIRAIERAQSGLAPTKSKPDFEILQLAIDLPREKLYNRIDKRVDQRFEEGMLEEVAGLVDRGVDINWLIRLGLEYRIIGIYILSQRLGLEDMEIKKLIENYKLKTENFKSFNSMSQLLKYQSHAFARRQLTWFRRFSDINWIQNENEAKQLIDNFLKK